MGKRHIGDLGVFGGTPLFGDLRHVGRPNIGNRDRFIERVDAMFDRRWLTNNGPNLVEFERRLASFTGAPHCIAVCNATIGLEIVVRALELTGEVIVPSFTFIATAHALDWLGLTPVFCDVDPVTHTIDPVKAEALITPRTSAIIGVHTWGRSCDVEALSELADRHGLKLVFDAAHAFACSHNGKMIGSFGDAEVFSFHATKFVNSFEGGAIMTRDPRLAARLQRMRNFGFLGLDSVTSSGTNGKMSEISAAMGITSLESIDEFLEVNEINYSTYRSSLSGIGGIHIYDMPADEKTNYQYVVLEVDEEEFGLSRDAIVEILFSEGVFARRYFYPGVHKMEPYRSKWPEMSARLPVTERLAERLVQLPTGTAMSAGDVERTCKLLRFLADHHAVIADRLRVPRLVS